MKTHPQYEPWLQGMLIIAKHYRLDFSVEHVRVTINHESQSPRQLVLEEMARQLGLGMRVVAAEAASLDPWRLPLLAEFTGGQIAVINRMDNEGNVSLQFSGDGGLETTLTREALGSRLKGLMVLRPLESTPDARVDDYIKPYEKNWFWQLALKDWRRYGDIMLVALVANVLALSGMVFSMQVYDRVVPSQSEATLWVLFGGVMIAIVFEFIMRMLRVHISDVVGKRADLRISERVFAHALRIKNGARSKSTGSFIAQIRELESVRELITSTTIAALSDLPFFLLFVFILWMIGGPLVLVVLLAVPLLLIPGLLVQRPLGKLSSEGMRESAIRNATLVEAVQGIEDIKLMRAEQRFQNQWNNTKRRRRQRRHEAALADGPAAHLDAGGTVDCLCGGAAGRLLPGHQRRHDHRCAGGHLDSGVADHCAAVADLRRALALAVCKSGPQGAGRPDAAAD